MLQKALALVLSACQDPVRSFGALSAVVLLLRKVARKSQPKSLFDVQKKPKALDKIQNPSQFFKVFSRSFMNSALSTPGSTILATKIGVKYKCRIDVPLG